MSDYINLRASDVAADPEKATRKCGNCGELYVAAGHMRDYRCPCGSTTLYPMNDADVTGGVVTAFSVM
jgi:hypothetical protein